MWTDGRTDKWTDRQSDSIYPQTLFAGYKYAFDIETGNVYGQYQQHGFQWIELMKIYSCVKYERIIINSIPTFK